MTKAPGGSPDSRNRLAQNPSDFVRSVWLELRRVTWPTREEWVSATILTVVLVVIIGLYTFGCDWVFAQIFNFVHPAAR